ncbi:N-carbamoyl-D-amino-acid hydrolase [Roseomonas stagni]|uniref:N-carbamoyl-D-amino-acid hydrolase n=1 Tax=Falsiroseomonas algicola TaxID=2716930 RepID=A0A6M1LFN0_9PROT|nr:N-carbamoyl-D-amino-acid hydrolase [Falsiroseomonas algicola]NGM18952.1 N-carbamoyl-D-amino-acid hydrolase [Falsiroseomonas algicola]
MPRILTMAAAQLGPIPRTETRAQVVERLLVLMRDAAARGADIIVYPEAALTAFFPHWWIEDEAELDAWFETAMPSNETAPLFAEARRLKIGFHLGYCELVHEGGRKRRFNTAILVDKEGAIVGKYRKIHLPGHAGHEPWRPFQNLEKRYFEIGDLGWRAWRTMGGVMGLMICNDRRWPEAWRVLGLQGAEMVMLGYNTPQHDPAMPQTDPLQDFHNHLSMQAGCYANGTWAVCVAKAGVEEGIMQIGGSCIIAPSGQIVAQALTRGDELVMAACDLDACIPYKETMFNFARHRRVEHYGMIVERTGSLPPA